MGADYYLHVEAKFDNVWVPVGGMCYNVETKSYKLARTMWNGSRSYFGSTYRKLKELGELRPAKELSEAVRQRESWLDDYDTVVCVPISVLKNHLPKSKHDSFGFVLKSDIYNYEEHEEEIDEFLRVEEFLDLDEEAKKAYCFYEWDDPFGWPVHLRQILKIVDFQIDQFCQVNHIEHLTENVRLICILSE